MGRIPVLRGQRFFQVLDQVKIFWSTKALCEPVFSWKRPGRYPLGHLHSWIRGFESENYRHSRQTLVHRIEMWRPVSTAKRLIRYTVTCVCLYFVFACDWGTHVPSHMWRSEDNLRCPNLYSILFETGSLLVLLLYTSSWLTLRLPRFLLSLPHICPIQGLHRRILGVWLLHTFWRFELRSLYFWQQVILATQPSRQPTARLFYSSKSPFQGLAFNLTSATLSLLSLPRTIFLWDYKR